MFELQTTNMNEISHCEVVNSTSHDVAFPMANCLDYLVKTVKKVPNNALIRATSLCSLALVFEEVVKTNPRGEPFLLKDLVMVDSKFRDWKRILPCITPSYDISASPDPKILTRLAQDGAVFSCKSQSDCQLIAALDHANITTKLKTIPNDHTESGTLVYVQTETELLDLKRNVPSAETIIRLQPDYTSSNLPLFKSALQSSNVVGISIGPWPQFSEDALKDALALVHQALDIASSLKKKISILDIECEIGESHFEKNASIIQNLLSYFVLNEKMRIFVEASEYFTSHSHFLFTRVTRTEMTRRDGEIVCEAFIESSPFLHKYEKSRVVSCLPKQSSNDKSIRTLIYINNSQSPIKEILLPQLSVGEWLYWNDARPLTTHQSKLPIYHSFRFEGPEKKLELNFRPIAGNPVGFRSLSTEQWQQVIKSGHLQILSEKKNEFFDTYLLSESSLFVYPYKLIIKTCGISSPLLCTPQIKALARSFSTEIESVIFSRRSFICPSAQCYPHRSIDEEAEFLNREFPNGTSQTLGNPSCDHWFIFSSRAPGSILDETPTFEVTMTGKIDPSVLKLFWKNENSNIESVADKAGFAKLTPGAEIDQYAFTPCGFSYNGLKDQGFVTVHITPEVPLCYISFETNIKGLSNQYMLENLISTFKPAHFTVLVTNNGDKTTFLPGYKTTHQTTTIINGLPIFFERRKINKQFYVTPMETDLITTPENLCDWNQSFE